MFARIGFIDDLPFEEDGVCSLERCGRVNGMLNPRNDVFRSHWIVIIKVRVVVRLENASIAQLIYSGAAVIFAAPHEVQDEIVVLLFHRNSRGQEKK